MQNLLSTDISSFASSNNKNPLNIQYNENKQKIDEMLLKLSQEGFISKLKHKLIDKRMI